MKLNAQKLGQDILKVVQLMARTQWTHKPDIAALAKYPVLTREGLRNIKMQKGLSTVKTSGSTGEPVSVEKSYADIVWYHAATIREFIWNQWDLTKTIAIINPKAQEIESTNWNLPRWLNPNQGKAYYHGIAPISKLQKWLEEKNPHYISAFPSIIAQLDLTEIPNFIAARGTGEVGGTVYSTQECGVIAINCPHNPDMMHVMENIIIETEEDGSALITCQSNPYIKRYKHGDHIELGTCTCGRTLQAIKKVKGRVRNMLITPDGDKKWPVIGSKEYFDKFKIKKYQAVQTALDEIELRIIAPQLGKKEQELEELVQKSLEEKIKVSIKYVEDFPNYKHEEFVCLVK